MLKNRFSTPFQTDLRKARPSQSTPSLNVKVEEPVVLQPAPEPEPESKVSRKNMEGKVMRSKKTKLEELNSVSLNSSGEVVAFIQAFFPK